MNVKQITAVSTIKCKGSTSTHVREGGAATILFSDRIIPGFSGTVWLVNDENGRIAKTPLESIGPSIAQGTKGQSVRTFAVQRIGFVRRRKQESGKRRSPNEEPVQCFSIIDFRSQKGETVELWVDWALVVVTVPQVAVVEAAAGAPAPPATEPDDSLGSAPFCSAADFPPDVLDPHDHDDSFQ